MKRRLLVTTKIFGFALAATAVGCAAQTSPAPAAPIMPMTAPVAPPVQVAPPVHVASPEVSPVEPVATPVAPVKPPPRKDDPARVRLINGPRDRDPKLSALREELAGECKAASSFDRYRALCDADGYPLVGNVMRKTSVNMQPSTYCGFVRHHQKPIAAKTAQCEIEGDG